MSLPRHGEILAERALNEPQRHRVFELANRRGELGAGEIVDDHDLVDDVERRHQRFHQPPELGGLVVSHHGDADPCHAAYTLGADATRRG